MIQNMLSETLTINYGVDLNIVSLHGQILKMFKSAGTTDKIKKLREEIRKADLNTVKKYKQDQLDSLERQSNSKVLQDYIDATRDVLSRFNDLNKGHSFFNRNIDKTGMKPLLDEFILIAERFVSVQIHYDAEYICGVCMDAYEICGCQKAEPVTVNYKMKNEYENEENFVKALCKYQGKQGKKFEPEVFIELDDYFKKYGLPLSADVRRMGHNADGTRGKTSITMMNLALAEIDRTGLYSDINLLCYEYWGWALPDISELYDQVLSDYRETQKIYDILDKERKSSLNLQYRIYKHLQVRGVKVKSKNFRLPTTDEILKSHDCLWKKMCLGTGLKFIPTLFVAPQETSKALLTSLNKDTKKVESQVVNILDPANATPVVKSESVTDTKTLHLDIEDLYNNLKPYLGTTDYAVTTNQPNFIQSQTIQEYKELLYTINILNVTPPVVLFFPATVYSAKFSVVGKSDNTNDVTLTEQIEDNKVVLSGLLFPSVIEGKVVLLV